MYFFLKVREVYWCRVCSTHNIKEVEIFCVIKISNNKAIYFDILVMSIICHLCASLCMSCISFSSDRCDCTLLC